jgi:tetratricopeptide (TPR) repeat protein
MTRAGAHAEATDPFRRAVARDPTKAPYHYNLGASLQFIGELTAAETEYRQALRIDATYHRAWSSLAQVARAPLTTQEVAALEHALEQPTIDADAELHLCHALAKQHEDEGRYAAAFRLLERGKRRKAATLGYRFAADEALFHAAAQLPAALAEHGGAGHESREPIFIVGMPRTGTTLVERILSSHPGVFSAGELTNFGLVLKRAAATPSNRVLDAETLAAGASCDFAAVGAAYVESTRPRTGHTRRFIDKMPLNFFYAPLIRRYLPNAKIVCLRRNPLDTCLSNYRQLFATSFSYYNYAYDLADTGRYYAAFHALTRLWRDTLADNYLEVRYEDVVDDTEREARRLVEFCELPWDSRCLAFQDNAAPVATASSAQVRQPIYRSSLERWRHYERELEPLRKLLAAAGVL